MKVNNYSYEEIDILVKKSKEGCKSSMNTLIEILNPFIHDLCKHIWISNYEYDDLYQECVKNLIEAVFKYKGETKTFIPFATTCIRNNLYCIVRKRVKDKFQTSLEKVDFDLKYYEDFNKNLDLTEKNKLLQHIEICLNNLTDEHKSILIHYYLKHKKLNEFKTSKNPYSLKSNALKALKKQLSKIQH